MCALGERHERPTRLLRAVSAPSFIVWQALALPALAQEPANLLPNPSFELVEPPPPVAGKAAEERRADEWLPRTWNVWAQDGAVAMCPDDPAQAHSGRRCVHFQAERGAGTARYGPMPAPDGRAWTVRFWARGKGKVVGAAYDTTRDPWVLVKTWPFDLTDGWQACSFEFQPREGCRKWMLDLQAQAPADAWLDDVWVTYPGAVALGLPPDQPLGRDDRTLLYLPFEEPLNEDAFFIKQRAGLSAPGEGRFGRALVLGAQGYVACSANESLDPAQGTIEVWCKLFAPGNDGIYHSIVGIPGPEGMMLCKDQYSHIHFGFSSGWGRLSGATAMGYSWSWQPGVWRHFAACWDKELLQVFVDGKLIGWENSPKLSKALGPELAIGSEGMALDDLRISNSVRYRQLVPPGAP